MTTRHWEKETNLNRRSKVLNLGFNETIKERFSLLFQKQKMYQWTQRSWYDGRQGLLYILTGSTLHITTDVGCD